MPAGTPVRAAAAGEVALISEELGGLGAIVLIRHRDDLMTTYATLSDVAVQQGDAVQAGQIIGEVVAPRPAGAAVRRLPRHHQRRPDPLHRRLSPGPPAAPAHLDGGAGATR